MGCTGLGARGLWEEKCTAARVEGVFTGTRLARSTSTSIATSITSAHAINGVATAVCTASSNKSCFYRRPPRSPRTTPQAVSSSQVFSSQVT